MATTVIAPAGPTAGRSDGALVEAHLDGDPQAFDALYRRYRERLVRFCWKQTHDLPLAEDLAQEAMIRYLKKADTFDTSRPMWPWLCTVARNLVIDHHRRTDNEPELDPDLGSGDDGSNACTVIELDRIEERSELGSVLARLPERQQVALRLHHGQDWTTADVADYLEIKVNACKQLLYRARKNARQYYEELADSTEAAFSLAFVSPLFLAARERFQRSRTTIETFATDVASMTIALEAVAERAVAALVVVATVAFGGGDLAFAMEPATGATTPARAASHELSDAQLPPSTSNEERLEARSPAQPVRDSSDARAANLSTGAETSLPGVTSVSSAASYRRSEDRAEAHHEVRVDLGPYAPIRETVVTIPCDESSVAYQTACDTAEAVEDTHPRDDDGSDFTAASR